MKEVLMLLLAMIIGFAGGAGMFALIFQRKRIMYRQKYVLRVLRAWQWLFKQWERI